MGGGGGGGPLLQNAANSALVSSNESPIDKKNDRKVGRVKTRKLYSKRKRKSPNKNMKITTMFERIKEKRKEQRSRNLSENRKLEEANNELAEIVDEKIIDIEERKLVEVDKKIINIKERKLIEVDEAVHQKILNRENEIVRKLDGRKLEENKENELEPEKIDVKMNGKFKRKLNSKSNRKLLWKCEGIIAEKINNAMVKGEENSIALEKKIMNESIRMNIEENLKRKIPLKRNKEKKLQRIMKRKEEVPIKSCIKKYKNIILEARDSGLQFDRSLGTVVTPVAGKKSQGESPRL